MDSNFASNQTDNGVLPYDLTSSLTANTCEESDDNDDDDELSAKLQTLMETATDRMSGKLSRTGSADQSCDATACTNEDNAISSVT